MKTQLILNIDNQTVELAKLYAKEKDLSINELFENYIRLVFLNDHMYHMSSVDFNSIMLNSEKIPFSKKTNWYLLDKSLAALRHGLPENFKFDRDEANER